MVNNATNIIIKFPIDGEMETETRAVYPDCSLCTLTTIRIHENKPDPKNRRHDIRNKKKNKIGQEDKKFRVFSYGLAMVFNINCGGHDNIIG